MDPFLEDPAVWPDFHHTFITFIRSALLAKLPSNYDAGVEERVGLEEVEGVRVEGSSSWEGSGRAAGREWVPDVSVNRARGGVAYAVEEAEGGAEGGVATLEPQTLPVIVEVEVKQGYIEVRRQPDREVVTVIEVLSPSNKSGKGRNLYLKKRVERLSRGINMVEIDLLTGGERLEFARPLPAGDCFVFVSRGTRRVECDVYAWPLPDPLPTVPVPLRPPDRDIGLDLAATFLETYDRGRFERRMRYHTVPQVLGEERGKWAAGVVGVVGVVGEAAVEAT